MSQHCFNRREFLASTTSAVYFLSAPSLAQFSDPTELSIAQAGLQIRSHKLSPVDLVQAYLERIYRLDKRLNSFITITDEQALVRAKTLEAELRTGRWRGPLHGIPIALKDNIDTSGVRTTAASAAYANRIPEENAVVVDRLTEAGAIVLGKLNMHEFAFGATSAITHFGPVHNPWDLGRIPGGSSGGSGAAVAARLCAGALGTDTGGSIRIPAAHCGIVGLKATYGLVSVRGIIPFSVSLDHVGPMCRAVSDAALMLQAMAGYDSLDVASIDAQIPQYFTALQHRTTELRLGVPRTYYENVDTQILSALEQAHNVLGRLTAGMEDVNLPPVPETPLAFPEIYERHADLIDEKSELFHSLTLERILQGKDLPATDYVQAKIQLKLARNAISRVFEKVDLLVTPTVVQLPIAIEEARIRTGPAVNIRNTIPFNLYGIPSISIPCGLSQEGLPIGLQISGPSLGELDVLALAHAYEQATNWHAAIPPLT